MQPVSAAGFSDNKCFIFCRGFTHLLNPGDLFFFSLYDWLTSPLSLIRYGCDNTSKHLLIQWARALIQEEANRQNKTNNLGQIILNLGEKYRQEKHELNHSEGGKKATVQFLLSQSAAAHNSSRGEA